MVASGRARWAAAAVVVLLACGLISPGSAAPGTRPRTALPAGAASAACPGEPLVSAVFQVDTVARVAALGSELSTGPGRMIACNYGDGPEERPLRIDGELSLPTSDGYFILFRFMPTTSAVSLVSVDRVTGDGEIALGPEPPEEPVEGVLYFDIKVTVRLTIALADVRADGVPVRVGDRCATKAPTDLVLSGIIAIPLDEQPGVKSKLRETAFTIPPFAGCGVTEDMDPLLTGTVSGPDNKVKTTLTYLGPP